MPRALSDAQRSAIWERAQEHQSPATIAAQLHLCPRTVRHLLAGFRRQDGPQQPRYSHCGRCLAPTRQTIHSLVLQLRRQHPGWGAGRIQLQLRRLGLQPVPPGRTLRRWLAQAGLAPKRRPRPRPTPGPPTQPHDIWQMDAAEQVPLASGQRVSWLRLVDQFSGAVLQTVVFPPGELVGGPSRAGAGLLAPGIRPLGPAVAVEGR